MLCSLSSESYLLWHLFVLVTVLTFSGGAIFRRHTPNGGNCRLPHDKVNAFLQRIGPICFLFPNRNLFSLKFSDFKISLNFLRIWATITIAIWKEKKKKWAFVSINHFPSHQRCFLPFDDESFVRLIIGGVLPVFSGDVFPLDLNSSGPYFILVLFLEQILTALLWKNPPWKPPWKGVRDLGFGIETASNFSAYKFSQNQEWDLGISNFEIGDDGVKLWPDLINKSRLILYSTVMDSYLSVRKRFTISSEVGVLFLPPGLKDDIICYYAYVKASIKYMWRGCWSYIWVIAKDENHIKLCLNKANLIARSRRKKVSESSLTTFKFCLLIKVMPRAFWSFISKI